MTQKEINEKEKIYFINLIFLMFDLQNDLLNRLSNSAKFKEKLQINIAKKHFENYVKEINSLKEADILSFEDSKEDIFKIIQCSLIATAKGKLTNFMNLVSNFMKKMTNVSIN